MRVAVTIAFLFLSFGVLGSVDDDLANLQKAISDKDFATARSIFQNDTSALIKSHNYKDLSYYIPYAGYIADHFKQNGTETVEVMKQQILSWADNPRDKRQAWLEIHTYYRDNGEFKKAYDANAKALEITHAIEDAEPREWAMIERNLGVIANELNNLKLSKQHTLKAAEGFAHDPKTSESDILNIMNSLGAIYWYEAAYDSVEYYWVKALNYIDSMQPNLVNRYYLRSMIEGNLSAFYDVTGRTTASIRFARASIDHIRYFTAHGKDSPKWNRALNSLLISCNNLAAVYHGIGNYTEALKLHTFILEEKVSHYPPDHPQIFYSQVMLGREHYALKNFAEAKKWINKGITGYKLLPETLWSELASAYSTLALMAEEEGRIEDAKTYYRISEKNYEKAYNGNYDFVYLDFLKNASEFYAINHEPERAVSMSEKGMNYVNDVYGRNTLIGFRQTLNVGNVYYMLNRYDASGTYAKSCLDILDKIRFATGSSLDSLQVEFHRPAAALLHEKTKYQLRDVKTIAFLEKMLENLNQAMDVLNKRKAMMVEQDDKEMLIAENQELIEFTKKIQLELYDTTGNTGYIDELLRLQEEMVYSKIRGHLNRASAVSFSGVPEHVVRKEHLLKTELHDVLDYEGDLKDYLTLSREWEQFLNELKDRYPDYYALQYAGISIDSLNYPHDRQVVRYLFVDEQLIAIVFANDTLTVHKLTLDPALITEIPDSWDDPDKLGKLTNALYLQLWLPFENLLGQEQVTIIPDGELHNLSFEMLTRKQITDFDGFITNGLLADYTINYHYSLWLTQQYGSKSLHDTYAGFVPGFTDDMKQSYLQLAADSVHPDNIYLHLLPQPFTIDLIQKASHMFRGESYANETSTISNFKAHAPGNKIIHIGTHAESNNISPAYSRLIFAKSDQPNEENSLYAYEIYDTDLSSNLTLLTACETGKPVYRSGDGMISLTHAFHYAGSESLLTSLWKQDEKSGMELTNYFLQNLAEGESKDLALKKAKMEYLSKAQGRTRSPQYWAGLVLIGDPKPVQGLKARDTNYWGYGGIIAIIIFAYVIIIRRYRR